MYAEEDTVMSEDITEWINHDELIEILSRYYFRRSFTDRNTRGHAQWHIFIWSYSGIGSVVQRNHLDIYVGGEANVVSGSAKRVSNGFRAIDNWKSLLEELNAMKYRALQNIAH